MSARTYKAGGVLFLALAIGAVALAMQASNQRVAIQGPSAIAVLPDGSVWLSVDDALWRFDAQGKRVAVVPPRVHGVDGLIANLVVHPGGQLVASMREDPDLHFLDPATGSARSRLRPRWPADLERHGDRAITYAFHPDGRLAVATGGGHAVALFDAGGGFLARTAAGTYEFSNGLWWNADSLWTTDTNRPALVELDGRSLAVKSRVALSDSGDARKYLGMATGWPKAPAAEGAAGAPPLGTVVRFANDMIRGNVADVLASGGQRAYPVPGGFEPRDIKWRGDELLVVDGASYAVKRFSIGRQPLADFGDPASRTALSDSLLRREALQARYRAGLAAALALFAMGAFLAWRSQALEQAQRLAALKVDLSQLGNTPLTRSAALRIGLRLAWPMLAMIVPMGIGLAFLAATPWPAAMGSRWKLLSAAVLFLLALTALALTLRGIRRAAQDPEIDALLNQRALHALAFTDAFWRLRDPGELPRETLMLPLTPQGLLWLVLTNQRLLVFAANLRDFTLKKEYPRRDVLKAQVLESGGLSWRQRVQAALAGAVWLRLELRDGSALEGATPASRTARRLSELLRGSTLEAPSSAQLRRIASLAPGRVPDEGKARAQTIASLLVPGLGQWMQGRGGTALLMFVPWLGLVLAIGLPLVWALWGPRSAVPAPFTLQFAAVYAMLCCVSAVDSWRMRARGDQVGDTASAR